MSAALLAAGSGCAGPPHRERLSRGVTSNRMLTVSGGVLTEAAVFGLKSCPIPGAAHPLAADPFRLMVLLDDAEALHLDLLGRPRWRALDAFKKAMEGDSMMTTKKGEAAPLILAAWGLCGGGFAVLDRERKLWRWTAQGRAPLAGAPIPGTGRVLAVIAESGVTVVLDDGSRHAWGDGRWFPLPGFGEASGKVKVRVRSGYCEGQGVDHMPGDLVELDEAEARKRLREGRVELVGTEISA